MEPFDDISEHFSSFLFLKKYCYLLSFFLCLSYLEVEGMPVWGEGRGDESWKFSLARRATAFQILVARDKFHSPKLWFTNIVFFHNTYATYHKAAEVAFLVDIF